MDATMGGLGPDYALFLSYNSKDRETLEPIHAGLSSSGVTAFMDERALSTGLPFMSELSSAIKKSHAVAVFIGAYGVGSYQDVEIQLAIDRQIRERGRGREVPVFAVLLPGAKPDDIPDMLRLNSFIDFREVIDSTERVQRVLQALNSRPGIDVRHPKRWPRALIWATVILSSVSGATWWYSGRSSPLVPLQGPTALDWRDPKKWEGAVWSGTESQALAVTGPIPGFLSIGPRQTLTDFRVDFNIAIQRDQSPISWVVRSEDAAKRYSFQFSLPYRGAAGVFSGRLLEAGHGEREICRSDLYTEVIGAGHALYVEATFNGNAASHRFNLTCPNNDKRCEGEHDILENLFQTVGCALQGSGARERRFGFVAAPGGSFEVQEFELTGMRTGKP